MTSQQPAIEAARRGDLDAFNTLVLAHQTQVHNLCMRILGSPAAAEDASQETFLTAWRKLSQLRGESFRPWLLRIAVNACRDELRRRGRRPASSLEVSMAEGLAEPADPEPLPEAAALSGELRRQIEAALLALPEDQRTAIVLSDIQGLDYEEIAQVTRASLGTVKSRLSRGRARLRALLLAQPELLPPSFRPNREAG